MIKQDQLREWKSTWRRAWGMREGEELSDIGEGPRKEHFMNRNGNFGFVSSMVIRSKPQLRGSV